MWYFILTVWFVGATGPTQGMVRFGDFKSQEDCEFVKTFLLKNMFEKEAIFSKANIQCTKRRKESGA